MIENISLPLDNEAYKVYECYFCDISIYEGEKCYFIDNLIYCEDCINNHFKIMVEKPGMASYLGNLEYHDIK